MFLERNQCTVNWKTHLIRRLGGLCNGINPSSLCQIMLGKQFSSFGLHPPLPPMCAEGTEESIISINHRCRRKLLMFLERNQCTVNWKTHLIRRLGGLCNGINPSSLGQMMPGKQFSSFGPHPPFPQCVLRRIRIQLPNTSFPCKTLGFHESEAYLFGKRNFENGYSNPFPGRPVSSSHFLTDEQCPGTEESIISINHRCRRKLLMFLERNQCTVNWKTHLIRRLGGLCNGINPSSLGQMMPGKQFSSFGPHPQPTPMCAEGV
ncbi:hypothetical protein CEXT_57781 [Caerostris extrusa]|uniref:Uncharacterized protein n=1 Tax=Caerostris extrusa TaxID=172846 RepID=A0AAV4VGC6_CAEEX|nr:hypothetical protein CEXT_57781 [Caerostris extrusa]